MREPTQEEMIEGIANGFNAFLKSKGKYLYLGTNSLELIFEKAIREAVVESIKLGYFVPKTDK